MPSECTKLCWNDKHTPCLVLYRETTDRSRLHLLTLFCICLKLVSIGNINGSCISQRSFLLQVPRMSNCQIDLISEQHWTFHQGTGALALVLSHSVISGKLYMYVVSNKSQQTHKQLLDSNLSESRCHHFFKWRFLKGNDDSFVTKLPCNYSQDISGFMKMFLFIPTDFDTCFVCCSSQLQKSGVESAATRTLECRFKIHQHLLNQSWLNFKICWLQQQTQISFKWH